jgi:hypothetical protein
LTQKNRKKLPGEEHHSRCPAKTPETLSNQQMNELRDEQLWDDTAVEPVKCGE